MEAVILLAGYGSRLNRQDIPHKSLLPFGSDTLLSRHLSCLQELGIVRTHLVLGHNKDKLTEYVLSLKLDLSINFIDNELYLTTGNTLSMVLGLRQCSGEVLILDGDVLYPRPVLIDYARTSSPSSFALTPGDIDNEGMKKGSIRQENGGSSLSGTGSGIPGYGKITPFILPASKRPPI